MNDDLRFSGSIPELYDQHLVPMFFEPYARNLAGRVAARDVTKVLEVAAGTGVLTRALTSALPADTSIVATDLNEPMLQRASSSGTTRPVEWQQADALQLPFADGTFDAVVCQFGVMFFSDKVRAYSEFRRVLKPSGFCAMSVWDRLEENEFAWHVTRALEPLFPDDPPRFMARIPHGYYEQTMIAGDLAAGGFRDAQFSTVDARSRADSPYVPAFAICHGTPLRNEIEARDPSRLNEATAAATALLAHHFGIGPIEGKMRAHVVIAERA